MTAQSEITCNGTTNTTPVQSSNTATSHVVREGVRILATRLASLIVQKFDKSSSSDLNKDVRRPGGTYPVGETSQTQTSPSNARVASPPVTEKRPCADTTPDHDATPRHAASPAPAQLPPTLHLYTDRSRSPKQFPVPTRSNADPACELRRARRAEHEEVTGHGRGVVQRGRGAAERSPLPVLHRRRGRRPRAQLLPRRHRPGASLCRGVRARRRASATGGWRRRCAVVVRAVKQAAGPGGRARGEAAAAAAVEARAHHVHQHRRRHLPPHGAARHRRRRRASGRRRPRPRAAPSALWRPRALASAGPRGPPRRRRGVRVAPAGARARAAAVPDAGLVERHVREERGGLRRSVTSQAMKKKRPAVLEAKLCVRRRRCIASAACLSLRISCSLWPRARDDAVKFTRFMYSYC
jgi:hypothetical protein